MKLGSVLVLLLVAVTASAGNLRGNQTHTHAGIPAIRPRPRRKLSEFSPNCEHEMEALEEASADESIEDTITSTMVSSLVSKINSSVVQNVANFLLTSLQLRNDQVSQIDATKDVIQCMQTHMEAEFASIRDELADVENEAIKRSLANRVLILTNQLHDFSDVQDNADVLEAHSNECASADANMVNSACSHEHYALYFGKNGMRWRMLIDKWRKHSAKIRDIIAVLSDADVLYDGSSFDAIVGWGDLSSRVWGLQRDLISAYSVEVAAIGQAVRASKKWKTRLAQSDGGAEGDNYPEESYKNVILTSAAKLLEALANNTQAQNRMNNTDLNATKFEMQCTFIDTAVDAREKKANTYADVKSWNAVLRCPQEMECRNDPGCKNDFTSSVHAHYVDGRYSGTKPKYSDGRSSKEPFCARLDKGMAVGSGSDAVAGLNFSAQAFTGGNLRCINKGDPTGNVVIAGTVSGYTYMEQNDPLYVSIYNFLAYELRAQFANLELAPHKFVQGWSNVAKWIPGCVDGPCECKQGDVDAVPAHSIEHTINCQNGGNPTGNTGNCKCKCAAGYSGTNCEIAMCTAGSSGNADEIECQNGGTPKGVVGSCRCECKPGYSGTNCETGICKNNPCKNEGTCTEDGVGSYTCTCKNGYEGENCDITCPNALTYKAPKEFGECKQYPGSCCGEWGNCKGEWMGCHETESECNQHRTKLVEKRKYELSKCRWMTRPRKHCANKWQKASSERYSTIERARAACELNADCFGVYDDRCDGKVAHGSFFAQCKADSGPTTWSTSQIGSCVYEKKLAGSVVG